MPAVKNTESLGSPVAPVHTRQCAGTSFHTRRLELPNGKGWIEIRGEFNAFDFDDEQRRLIAMMADWFRDFERTYAHERTTHSDSQTIALQTERIEPKAAS